VTDPHSRDFYVLYVGADSEPALEIETELQKRTTMFRMFSVGTARDSIQFMRSHRVDILIIDLLLPDMSGFELMELLRIEGVSALAIATAAHGNERLAADAIKAGAREYIPMDHGFVRETTSVIEEMVWDLARKPAPRNEPTKAESDQAETMRVAANTLAHEINNPLMAIYGLSELILGQSQETNPDLARKVQIIATSARRIEAILRRLTDVAQPVMRETPSGRLIDTTSSLDDPWNRE